MGKHNLAYYLRKHFEANKRKDKKNYDVNFEMTEEEMGKHNLAYLRKHLKANKERIEK